MSPSVDIAEEERRRAGGFPALFFDKNKLGAILNMSNNNPPNDAPPSQFFMNGIQDLPMEVLLEMFGSSNQIIDNSSNPQPPAGTFSDSNPQQIVQSFSFSDSNTQQSGENSNSLNSAPENAPFWEEPTRNHSSNFPLDPADEDGDENIIEKRMRLYGPESYDPAADFEGQNAEYRRLRKRLLRGIKNGTIDRVYTEWFLLEIEDLQELGEILKTNTNLTSLDLSGNGFNEKAMEHVAKILENQTHNPNLSTLDVSKNPLGSKGTQILCEALSKYSNHLTEINLNQISNLEKENCAKPLNLFFSTPNTVLKSLSLVNNSFFNCSEQMFSGWAIQNLETLSLRGNRISIQILCESVLSVTRTLKTLDLSSCSLADSDVQILVDNVLKQDYCHISTLNLSQNYIGNLGAQKLAGYVEKNQKIDSLQLVNNQIRTDGLIHFSKALEKNASSLKKLNINMNFFGKDEAKLHFKALKTNSMLTLFGCEGMDYYPSFPTGEPFKEELTRNIQFGQIEDFQKRTHVGHKLWETSQHNLCADLQVFCSGKEDN